MFEQLLQFTQRLSWELNLASAMPRYVTFGFPIGSDKKVLVLYLERPTRDDVQLKVFERGASDTAT
jgi:hypothetical protein